VERVFSRAIRPQQAENLTPRDRKTEAVDGTDGLAIAAKPREASRAKNLHQVFDLYSKFAHVPPQSPMETRASSLKWIRVESKSGGELRRQRSARFVATT
jgi:hypothetical protein